jgi:hypothetical protein
MIVTLLWFLLAFAIGIGFLFLAFHKRARVWLARQHWLWGYAKTSEDKETVENFSILTPLMAGLLITSGALAAFLVWLLT